mgnify:CR=1 FL=1
MSRIQCPICKSCYPEDLPADFLDEFQCLIWKYPEAGVLRGLADISLEGLIGNYLFLKRWDKEHG